MVYEWKISSQLKSVDLFFGKDSRLGVVVHVKEEYILGFSHGFEGLVCCFEEASEAELEVSFLSVSRFMHSKR